MISCNPLLTFPTSPILPLPASDSLLVTTSLTSVYMSMLLFCFIHKFAEFFKFHILVISYSICSSLTCSLSIKIELAYDLPILFLGITQKIQKDTHTLIFIAALFTIDKIWKQLKCVSTDEWIKKMWHICTHTQNGILLRHKKNEFRCLQQHDGLGEQMTSEY